MTSERAFELLRVHSRGRAGGVARFRGGRAPASHRSGHMLKAGVAHNRNQCQVSHSRTSKATRYR